MSGSVTFRQRINRVLYFREFRLYKYVWNNYPAQLLSESYSLPYFIGKFGDLL